MTFNYELIEAGFYDKIFDSNDGIRKFWHWHKFDSVLRIIDDKADPIKLLDVGCFSGSFTGRFLDEKYFHTTSIDILKTQIDYAKAHYQSEYKEFFYYENFQSAQELLAGKKFDVVTFVEVIEHLDQDQIFAFFKMIDSLTYAGSEIIITTPNYLSLWPILEVALNVISDVKYEEQHITKFTTFNIVKKLSRIYPQFLTNYKVDIITTSHFFSPYVSLINYQWAKNISAKYRGSDWKNPFGSIVMLKLIKR